MCHFHARLSSSRATSVFVGDNSNEKRGRRYHVFTLARGKVSWSIPRSVSCTPHLLNDYFLRVGVFSPNGWLIVDQAWEDLAAFISISLAGDSPHEGAENVMQTVGENG